MEGNKSTEIEKGKEAETMDLTMELFEIYKQETGAVEVEMFAFQEWLIDYEMSQLSL